MIEPDAIENRSNGDAREVVGGTIRKLLEKDSHNSIVKKSSLPVCQIAEASPYCETMVPSDEDVQVRPYKPSHTL